MKGGKKAEKIGEENDYDKKKEDKDDEKWT